MPTLERLRREHGPAVLAFEQDNRAYFAASILDRGDDYFANFAARQEALLAEQATGRCAFHVLVDGDGEVVGRVNLVDIADGVAELGFRVARRVAGRGVATAAVRQVCVLAAVEYDLTALRAAAARDNTGSRTVLTRTGFVPDGELLLPDGKQGVRYVRSLADQRPER